MPRRQRFKPSRKPKPAIEPSEQQEAMQSQVTQQDMKNAEPGQPESEERVPR